MAGIEFGGATHFATVRLVAFGNSCATRLSVYFLINGMPLPHGEPLGIFESGLASQAFIILSIEGSV